MVSIDFSLNHLIRLYDRATGRFLQALRFHESFVKSLRFSPDGALLFSRDDSGGVAVWQLKGITAKELFQIKENGIKFGADGERLPHPPASIADTAMVPQKSGALLATLDRQGTLELFDPALPDKRRTMKIAVGSAIDASSRSIAVAGPDGKVRLFDLNMQEIFSSPPDMPLIDRVSLSSDGRYLALREKSSKKAMLIDTRDNQFLAVPLPEQKEDSFVTTTFTSPTALFAQTPEGVVSWDIERKSATKPIRYSLYPLQNLEISGDFVQFSQKRAGASHRYAFNYKTLALAAPDKLIDKSVSLTADIEPSYLNITIEKCSGLRRYCLKYGDKAPMQIPGVLFDKTTDIKLSRDGMFVIGTPNGYLSLENMDTMPLDEEKAHSGSVTGVAVFGNIVTTVGTDNIIKVWDIAQLQECHKKLHVRFSLLDPMRDSQAEKAGLKSGDFVVAINGRHFRNSFEVLEFLKSPGKYTIELERNGKPLTVTIEKKGAILGMYFKSEDFKIACHNSIKLMASMFIDDNGDWVAWKQDDTIIGTEKGKAYLK
jgi:WD40 repeat protein